MKLPEPVVGRVWCGLQDDGNEYVYSEELDGEPLFTEAQLREALASHEAVMRMALEEQLK